MTEPTPGYRMQRVAVDVLKFCYWHFLKVHHCSHWCELRYQLLYFLGLSEMFNVQICCRRVVRFRDFSAPPGTSS